MRNRHGNHARERQDGLRRTMWGKQRNRHSGKPRETQRERKGAAMRAKSEAQRETGHENGKYKAELVHERRPDNHASRPEQRNQHKTRHTMRGAQTRQGDAQAIHP